MTRSGCGHFGCEYYGYCTVGDAQWFVEAVFERTGDRRAVHRDTGPHVSLVSAACAMRAAPEWTAIPVGETQQSVSGEIEC